MSGHVTFQGLQIPSAVAQERKEQGQGPAVRPSQHLISPSSDLSLLPMRFIGCSLLVWALVTRRAAPDIPVRSTGLFPTNTATARSAPILHIPLLGVRMPGI